MNIFCQKDPFPYLETHIADSCNLNCAGCTHFSPLQDPADPNFKDLEDFTAEVNRVGELFPNLATFRIMGGEPLLNPNWPEYFHIARAALPKTNIVLVTNGILLPQNLDQITELINQEKITLSVSDYGLFSEYLQNLHKGSSAISAPPRAHNHMYNVCLDFNHTYDSKEAFDTCQYNNTCRLLKDGRIYICPTMAYLPLFQQYFNITPPETCDPEYNSIDIFSHTSQEIIDFFVNGTPGCSQCDTRARNKTMHDFYQSNKQKEEWLTC